ncbi:hypothetical protein DFH09DRAFT_1273768 [Mycena vulgaris]|nr:hypothetical protein DFH09DRAFT_1273768 [Mycena vulgaris]
MAARPHLTIIETVSETDHEPPNYAWAHGDLQSFVVPKTIQIHFPTTASGHISALPRHLLIFLLGVAEHDPCLKIGDAIDQLMKQGSNDHAIPPRSGSVSAIASAPKLPGASEPSAAMLILREVKGGVKGVTGGGCEFRRGHLNFKPAFSFHIAVLLVREGGIVVDRGPGIRIPVPLHPPRARRRTARRLPRGPQPCNKKIGPLDAARYKTAQFPLLLGLHDTARDRPIPAKTVFSLGRVILRSPPNTTLASKPPAHPPPRPYWSERTAKATVEWGRGVVYYLIWRAFKKNPTILAWRPVRRLMIAVSSQTTWLPGFVAFNASWTQPKYSVDSDLDGSAARDWNWVQAKRIEQPPGIDSKQACLRHAHTASSCLQAGHVFSA